MYKNIKDVAVVIQARLGSQRVPRKMIREFGGTTLVDLALEKIKKCETFSEENFYLSVYEKELVDIGNNHNVNIFKRSQASADSEGTPMSLMYEWWNKLPYKYCILVSACTPFLNHKTIDNFVKRYLETESDGLFAVIEKKNYFWNDDFSLITEWPEGQDVMNTKFVGKTYEAAHCLYAGKMSKIGESIWMGDFGKKGDIELFPIHEMEALDIDYEWQFKMC